MDTKMNKLLIILVFICFSGIAMKIANCQTSLYYAENNSVSIQDAIDQLPESGGEVFLPHGTYIINNSLQLKSNVKIHGAGPGTVLLVQGGNDTGILLESLNNTVVADLTIMPAKKGTVEAGIILDDCGGCQVRNVHIQGFAKYGFWLRNNSFLCDLSTCKSADNGQANFYFENLKRGRGGDYVPNMVNNSSSYGGKHGFELKGALVLNITGCIVYQSLDDGFYLHDGSNSVLISASRTFQVGGNAVTVENSHEVNLSGNIFCWQREHGIVLKNAKWGSISSNNVIDNGVRTRDGSYRNGVVLKDKTMGIQITSNAIFNWGDQTPMEYGITEDSTCANNLISINNINYFTQEGILSQGKGTLVSNNVMNGERAYIGTGRTKFPDFDTLKIHQFMHKSIPWIINPHSH